MYYFILQLLLSTVNATWSSNISNTSYFDDVSIDLFLPNGIYTQIRNIGLIKYHFKIEINHLSNTYLLIYLFARVCYVGMLVESILPPRLTLTRFCIGLYVFIFSPMCYTHVLLSYNSRINFYLRSWWPISNQQTDGHWSAVPYSFLIHKINCATCFFFNQCSKTKNKPSVPFS